MKSPDRAWRVLVVEDSKMQARMLEHTLISEGYAVEVAYDAEQAREFMRQRQFDVVLSDIVMPGDSGYDLCRHIKSNPTTSSIPVVLITSLHDVHDIVEGLECGADNFFTKPADPVALLQRLRNLRVTQSMVADGQLKSGVEVFFMGRTVTLNQDRQQIFNLLLSTCEDIVRKNEQLSELMHIRTQLEEYAKRLQSKLTQHVGKYRLLFERAQQPMAFLDAEGTIEEVNEAACQLFDGTHAELVGRSITTMLALPEDFDALLERANEQRIKTRLTARGLDLEVTLSRLELEARFIVGLVAHTP